MHGQQNKKKRKNKKRGIRERKKRTKIEGINKGEKK